MQLEWVYDQIKKISLIQTFRMRFLFFFVYPFTSLYLHITNSLVELPATKYTHLERLWHDTKFLFIKTNKQKPNKLNSYILAKLQPKSILTMPPRICM